MYKQYANDIIKQDDNSKVALQSFITETEDVFVFPDLTLNNLRTDLWNCLYVMATSTKDEQVKANCFTAVRILSRDKYLLDELFVANDWLKLIKKSIGLDDIKKEFTDKTKMVAIEAQKCLCNAVFNSNNIAKICSENSIIYNLNDRIKIYNKISVPDEIKYFDVKILFIITAVCADIRKPLGKKKNCIFNLIDLLDTINKNRAEGIFKDKQVDIACEALKTLFNLTAHLLPNGNMIGPYLKLSRILYEYLLSSFESDQKRLALHNNVIHLLTNLPNPFLPELVPAVTRADYKIGPQTLDYNGHDVAALKVILKLFEEKVKGQNLICTQLEVISPTATLLYKGACACRIIRKYLRSEILPPLKDIHNRPEEGNTLRNHLCRLLTTPVMELRHIISELLFVLCKKNARRMVKYTGYGNAAGLFAQRGLLGIRQDEERAEFSSDSEDSETEEYAQNKHKINPVIGCLEPEHPDAMAGMTLEQKEYEAMQMVKLFDQMARTGAIKPCRIDENGKPVPIDHVLQLQKTDICNNETDE